MTSLRLRFITINQSPSDDVLRDLPETLVNIQLVQKCALDELISSQIGAMRPTGNETVYVSRLRYGSEVSIAK